jgi:hypothetical protein
VTADRGSYLPSDPVNVDIDIDPASANLFLGTFYNVDHVAIVRKSGPFTTQTLATQNATTGQTHFDLSFIAPGLLAAGELFGFVVPRFVPLDPPKLEIGPATGLGAIGRRAAPSATSRPDSPAPRCWCGCASPTARRSRPRSSSP